MLCTFFGRALLSREEDSVALILLCAPLVSSSLDPYLYTLHNKAFLLRRQCVLWCAVTGFTVHDPRWIYLCAVCKLGIGGFLLL